jgi:uncharacterized membrane protein YfcA
MEYTLGLPILFLAVAILYSSVGHAGASGYLAAMALVGMAPSVMKPTALVLNILVAAIATARFARVGGFSWDRFWPFALGAIPLAFLGGAVALPARWYNPAVGLVLLFAAWRLWRPAGGPGGAEPARVVSRSIAIASGAGIGLLAGLTGTGGGIFLSPLARFMGWAESRRAAGISATFNLANSLAGLAGQMTGLASLPPQLPYWATAAGVGGLIGSGLGSRHLGSRTLDRLLAVVLVVAGAKLILA